MMMVVTTSPFVPFTHVQCVDHDSIALCSVRGRETATRAANAKVATSVSVMLRFLQLAGSKCRLEYAVIALQAEDKLMGRNDAVRVKDNSNPEGCRPAVEPELVQRSFIGYRWAQG
jgi:hypothetical protein